MKTFRIFTLGCKVNQYDSQSIRERLCGCGLSEAAAGQPPDICVVNTCTVTGKAERESRYQVRRLRRDFPGSRIVVTGCARVPGADLSVCNRDKGNIARLIAEHIPGIMPQGSFFPAAVESITSFSGRTRAFLKVQDGCDNFCSYCAVPFARGKPKSKLPGDAAREACALVMNGYKEIVLTGICLGSYGKDLSPRLELCDVIDAIEPGKGLCRIRLSSIEALQVTPRLVRKMGKEGKLCPHLHIPLQSGDDSVLKRMNRPYTARRFLSLIRQLKRKVKDFALTTDVMVGFPGETEKNFRNTLAVVRELEPLKTHIFTFSPRPGTKAFLMEGRPDHREVRERAGRLEEESRRLAEAYRARFRGRKMEVLFEAKAKGVPDVWQGYTANYLEVGFKSTADLSNTLMTVPVR